MLDVTGVRWLASAALLLVLASGGAAAEDYPSHPIKLLVGFSADGGFDINCRHWAQRLSARLGQQVVVENRPGASGELAVKQAMASKPDGYTLVCLSGSNTISSSKPSPLFDIRSDVAPVIQMTRFTFVLYVNPSLPVKSFAEFVAYAKANPGKLNYGSVGTGSTPHLAFEFLKLHTGIDIVHIPFKGTAQTASAVIAGDVQVGLDAIAAVKGHFDAGTLRPLAVVSAKRTWLRKFGFPGDVWPVNPKRASVAGERCYPNLEALPAAAELAIIALSAGATIPAVRDCVRAGIRNGIVWAGGFAETGEEGARLQHMLAELCRDSSFLLCGPNCLGIINAW